MRTPSSQKCRLDLVPPLADRFILGMAPSITARYFSSCPSDSTSRWTPCPPEYSKRWLQVSLGCVQLSLSCPFRRLHTFHFSPASEATNPASWIWHPSFGHQRDFNPPEQRAAQRTLPDCRQSDRNPRFDLQPVWISASACSRHWTATAGFVVTQDFFTYCLAAKVDG
jgi:hypothetical protein